MIILKGVKPRVVEKWFDKYLWLFYVGNVKLSLGDNYFYKFNKFRYSIPRKILRIIFREIFP